MGVASPEAELQRLTQKKKAIDIHQSYAIGKKFLSLQKLQQAILVPKF